MSQVLDKVDVNKTEVDQAVERKQRSSIHNIDLDTLLRRHDVWRGSSQVFVAQQGIDTGFAPLNQALLHKGWPEASLIECAQSVFSAHWFLVAHAIKHILQQRSGVVALLNPPNVPYAPGLLSMDLDTNQLIVVTVKSKADFVACFVELSRSSGCSAVLAWQPKQKLSYSELRKCQLATTEQAGLYFLFRHSVSLQQSSPAALKISSTLAANSLNITLEKQRGGFTGQTINLPLPETLFRESDYVNLLSEEQSSPLHWLEKENIRVVAFKKP